MSTDEANVRAALELMPQLVWTTGPDGYHDYYNERWYAYTGMPRPGDPAASAEGWNWKTYLHPDDYERTIETWSASLATGAPYEFEYRFREAATGEYRWFLGRALPLRDASGAIVRWFGTCTDIHEQQTQRDDLELTNQQLQEQTTELEAQTEELQCLAAALEERTEEAEAARRHAESAEAQLHAVFEQAPAAVVVTDGPEHRFVLLNERAVQIVGGRELVGRTFAGAFPELEAQGFVALLDRVYATGAPFAAQATRVVINHEHEPPSERWFDFVYQPLRDDQGLVTGIMQHAVDVTDQVRTRQALAENERQFQTLADAIPTLAWTARADGFIDWYNARWYEYTATTPEQMEGWGWRSVHDAEVLPKVLEQWEASIRTGEPFEMTFPLRGGDGIFRRFLTRVTPVRDADGQVVRWFGTNTDVEVERAARAAAEAANAAKSEFLSTMSHELRTPLNAIAGYAELLEMGVRGPVTEQQAADLTRIRRASQHLQSLINDILNFARLDAGQVQFDLQDVSVESALADVETFVMPQIRAGGLEHHRASFGSDSRGQPLAVRADPEKLRQILLNLLTNAIKFTAPGGRVTLSAEVGQHPGGSRSIEILVSDTGRGIPSSELGRIFEPFVQVDRHLSEASQQGVGLGLAISRDLARAMGGDLTVTSDVGVGSTFRLVLPCPAA